MYQIDMHVYFRSDRFIYCTYNYQCFNYVETKPTLMYGRTGVPSPSGNRTALKQFCTGCLRNTISIFQLSTDT